eukprot:TRINITY_DN45970_c0_g1_i1.p1 TRINITY_DN45970_c0_g1~~TRINITY_DN45970_c0_g1_i1.p1  ORF type:complete len:163 (+),score=18.13 TRINITY_DN45970_c0_g1_i1:50-490(+)
MAAQLAFASPSDVSRSATQGVHYDRQLRHQLLGKQKRAKSQRNKPVEDAEVVKDGVRHVSKAAVELLRSISAAGRARHWGRALGLLSSLEFRCVEADVAIFTAAMHSCEQAERWSVALACAEQLRHEGLFPDITTYNVLIKTHGRA